jgi:hypothetical protein
MQLILVSSHFCLLVVAGKVDRRYAGGSGKCGHSTGCFSNACGDGSDETMENLRQEPDEPPLLQSLGAWISSLIIAVSLNGQKYIFRGEKEKETDNPYLLVVPSDQGLEVTVSGVVLHRLWVDYWGCKETRCI